MLRFGTRTSRHCIRSSLLRNLSSSSSSSSPRNFCNSEEYPLQNTQLVTPPTILHRSNSLSPFPSWVPRKSIIAVSATLISAIVASYAVISSEDDSKSRTIYDNLELAVEKSNESVKRIVNRMKHTGIAASVLWKSLASVLSSANHEVRSGFELRVAALLADIAAANESRRAAIVGAGGGAVLDWLLETVVVGGDNCGTQAESARALSYLIADPNVCGAVLGRPNAVPNLLRFIFSAQPQRSKKPMRRSSFDLSDSLKGRSMLVAAIMDIVTSNCDNAEKVTFMPSLPANAVMRDIAAAIQVVEEGGMHLDDSHVSEGDDDDGEKGIKGIGMKVLGGTSVLGHVRTNGIELDDSDAANLFNKMDDSLSAQASLSSSAVPGLWDDLYSQHVAVPFAAWALANWATASEANRSHIQELDRDGHAVMTALLAPERSVKWHGSLVARLLLEDKNLPLNDSVSDWSSSLLSTVAQACKADDMSLAQVALSAFLVSIQRSPVSQTIVIQKGLHLMRETAKLTTKCLPVQETLAKALELLCTRDKHLSLEESQKWSGTLLSWVFGKSSSDDLRSSAIKILSCILEYQGPSSVPISQGWLAILLTNILASGKSTLKGSSQPRNDKVKTQIDQANILSGTQSTNQLASAVVTLAGNQLRLANKNDDTVEFPLSDLLSLEPFSGPFKNLKKDTLPKINAAESAVATLKGIKSLTEICSEDIIAQNKIVDFGVLCLLRRFLLRDDYEKLAAIEAYDASRDFEPQDHISEAEIKDPNAVRVPPTAHIRRHAARLLTILSVLPKVQKELAADETWCKWLEECASGKILGCNDLKMQSYARATLLNTFCTKENDTKSENERTLDKKRNCAHYADMIFLINPELSHWKCLEKIDLEKGSERRSPEAPLLDVVFVHGLRGGPFKTWRVADDKSSTKSGLVEKIDEEAGKHGTFWPGEWLSPDFKHARMFSIKYKTNLTQWSGASLPLQEVSSMLLEKLNNAGIGDRPVVFVTHSMGGLVVKQMLYQARAENKDNLVNNTVGVVFYSCPHFGSKLADMPWRMGLVFRPAPTIGELRSGSPRLVELNDMIRNLHKKGLLEVLSFCETKVTPIVEGYGGWAFRMEIVPIESAYPGFGELVVLDSTDHVNSCKPLNKSDPSYRETLELLYKLKAQLT